MKQSADDNFKFDENSKTFPEWIENTVGKGEIAHYEQFLLCPLCFQMACFPGASKGVIVWEWVNSLLHEINFQQTGLENILVTVTEIEHQLTHYQKTNFRLIQTKRVCRLQFQI